MIAIGVLIDNSVKGDSRFGFMVLWQAASRYIRVHTYVGEVTVIELYELEIGIGVMTLVSLPVHVNEFLYEQ